MTDQVNRRKSYRWASASQASYDGADWDSNDNNYESHEESSPAKERQKISLNLPQLPKLEYARSEEVKQSDEGHDLERYGAANNRSNRDETPDIHLITPNAGSKSPILGENDLDELMKDLSREMTPIQESTAVFDSHHHGTFNSHAVDSSINELTIEDVAAENVDDRVTKSESQFTGDNNINGGITRVQDNSHETGDNEDLKNPNGGYFAQMINDSEKKFEKHEDSNIDSKHSNSEESGSELVPSSIESSDDGVSLINDYNDFEYSDEEQDPYFTLVTEDQATTNREDELLRLNSRGTDHMQSDDEQIVEEHQDSFKSEESITEEDYEDQLSYTESIRFTAGQNPSRDLEGQETSRLKTSTDCDTSDENDEKSTMQFSSDGAIISVDDGNPRNSYFKEDIDIAARDTTVKSAVENVEKESQDQDRSMTENNEVDEKDEVNSKESSGSHDDIENSTESLRSGFVQNSQNKKAPSGFVYDDSGNLVDLTPSSMKPRVVSTYSELDSTWNAFPSKEESTADLETVGDTKTIYDNHTIFNVPGLMTNNQNLPPVPDNFVRNASDSSSKALGSQPIRLLEPSSQDVAKIHSKNSIPELNINKVLNQKLADSAKLHRLRDNLKQLEEYETGLQLWITYCLKSSSNMDKSFLKEEFKSSDHVKQAYANADDLSKKNSVINTIVSVNENVSHLRKKVLLRNINSIKSKGIFSSIGKKRN